MPNLAGQPGSGSSLASRRDLLLGLDVIDTLDAGSGADIERGNLLVDEIIIQAFPTVRD